MSNCLKKRNTPTDCLGIDFCQNECREAIFKYPIIFPHLVYISTDSGTLYEVTDSTFNEVKMEISEINKIYSIHKLIIKIENYDTLKKKGSINKIKTLPREVMNKFSYTEDDLDNLHNSKLLEKYNISNRAVKGAADEQFNIKNYRLANKMYKYIENNINTFEEEDAKLLIETKYNRSLVEQSLGNISLAKILQKDARNIEAINNRKTLLND